MTLNKIVIKEAEALLSQIDSVANFIPLSAIAEKDSIDKAYKQFFNAEVEWRIFEEKLFRKLNRGSFIEKFIEKAEPEIEKIYRENAGFAKDELRRLAETAVKMRMNYLIRPRFTLNWFVFRGENFKRYGEIEKRLYYFSDYPYLIEAVKNFVRENNLNLKQEQTITQDNFVAAIENADKSFFRNLDKDEFSEAIDPIFNLTEEESVAPKDVLIIFLEDKNLNKIAAELKEECEKDGENIIEKDEFVAFIVDTFEKARELLGEIDFEEAPKAKVGDEAAVKKLIEALNKLSGAQKAELQAEVGNKIKGLREEAESLEEGQSGEPNKSKIDAEEIEKLFEPPDEGDESSTEETE